MLEICAVACDRLRADVYWRHMHGTGEKFGIVLRDQGVNEFSARMGWWLATAKASQGGVSSLLRSGSVLDMSLLCSAAVGKHVQSCGHGSDPVSSKHAARALPWGRCCTKTQAR